MPTPSPLRTFGQPETGALRRVRKSMYLAFAVLAAFAVLQALYTHRVEQRRAYDAELINIAGQQHAFALQIGRAAAIATADPATAPQQRQALSRAIAQSQIDAQQLMTLAAAGDATRAGDGGDVAAALKAWQSTRETLAASSLQLLKRLSADPGDEATAAAAAAVQTEVEPAVQAALTLSQRLQNAAEARNADQMRMLQAGVALTLCVLAVLSLLVVEPTARAVRDHVRRLRDQATELQRLALVAERTNNMVIITDADRTIIWVNDAFTDRTGYTLQEAFGRRPAELLHSDRNDADTVQRVRAALEAGEPVRATLLNRKKDGKKLWIDADIQPLHDQRGKVQGVVTVGTDVTEHRRVQAQLRRLVRTDALTGLPNRAVVLDRLRRAIDHAQRNPGYGFAVLFMDFDRFKQINDTLGHGAGDDLLRQIASRIETTLRPGDAVARVASSLQTAARVGGDEFVVVLEGIRFVDDAKLVAGRLLQALEEPYDLAGHSVQSSASIGVFTSDQGVTNAEEVLRNADTAMYEAKRAGRGRCVVFDSSMQERVVQALEMERDLKRALQDNELFVVYQPVLGLVDGELVAVEALVRWRHPTRGVILPVHFIGLAEEAGLIDQVGDHVLREACRQFAAWQRELGSRAPRQVAVNLSRAQLTLPGLVPEVKWVLQEYGMQPAQLQLEVTESLAAQDERVQATLRDLKALGVGLALDDFGTGYSSLACLHQLPVDTVKIDRSFVVHAESVEYHRVLIEATIRVAQTLGMTTVAEGIETEDQAALMKRLHCDRGQGFLYARPLAAEDLRRWVLEPAVV